MNEDIQQAMEIVNDWESLDKSGFIEDLLNFLPDEQREQAIKSIIENTPLTR